MTDIASQVAAIVRALEPDARLVTGRSTESVIVTLLRPYIRAALHERGEVEPDAREVEYAFTLKIWSYAQDDAPELVAELDEPERVSGLSAVTASLAGWLREAHDGEALSDDAQAGAVIKRTPTLRTSLARGNGRGSLRVWYTADDVRHMAHLEVERAQDVASAAQAEA